ncbi:MAG: hypothetical protein ACI8ZN_001132 [Bacteroidia bacterium]|jgi:hypothetical protein
MPDKKKHSTFTNLLITLGALLVCQEAFAQHSDTALYRRNKIKKITSYVHFNGFENSNDTCLYEVKEMNQSGKITRIWRNYSCNGYDMAVEIKYSYNKTGQHIIKSEIFQNNTHADISEFIINEFGQTAEVHTQIFEPFGNVHVYHSYFGPLETPDSMLTMEITNGDTTHLKTEYNYVAGFIKSTNMVDVSNNKPMHNTSLKYDSKSRMIKSTFVHFQLDDQNEITELTYNTLDQVVESRSDISAISAKFYYDKNGNLILTQYFNKFKTLEREVWNTFEIYDK